jgi:hypothetical protein
MHKGTEFALARLRLVFPFNALPFLLCLLCLFVAIFYLNMFFITNQIFAGRSARRRMK